MLPVIRISDSIFERLQALATPLVDTPATVIERLLDSFESQTPRLTQNTKLGTSATPSACDESARRFDADDPPKLAYADVLVAKFAGLEASEWNELVKGANSYACRRLGSFNALQSVTKSNVVQGQYEQKGFHYISDVDISVQNVDADHAWSYSLHLARKMDVPISVHFQWKDTPKAAHPGSQGILLFDGR